MKPILYCQCELEVINSCCLSKGHIFSVLFIGSQQIDALNTLSNNDMDLENELESDIKLLNSNEKSRHLIVTLGRSRKNAIRLPQIDVCCIIACFVV